MTVLQRWTDATAGLTIDLAYARRQAAYWRKEKSKAKRGSRRYSLAAGHLAAREQRVADLKTDLAYANAKRVVARHAPASIQEKAYAEATKLIGVMEQGGNNRGAQVEKIIRDGGGLPGQAWCGWFMAHCLKKAGSKSTTWQMGAVRLWLPLSGVSRTNNPVRGDAVRFTFDHIGMFVRDLGNGYIETIEGNTGSSGAVSDSITGGDGVYRKTRSKQLVRDYLHVSR